ncbi:MAG TPA: CHASE3 domain-containing protein, partial [Pseudonocardiaceae bacterium]|nr:CHASE3 domain-containing protein [Pseudonocardiaceae bacterium]
MTELTVAAAGPHGGSHWPLRRIIALSVLAMAVFSIVAATLSGLAVANLATARDQVVNRVDPAVQQALRLDAALLDQETGVRGYALAGVADFLTPYTDGLATQQDAVGKLHPLLTGIPSGAADLAVVTARADAWRGSYAQPTIDKVRATNAPVATSATDLGKASFDSLRSSVATLQRDLGQARQRATTSLNQAAGWLNVVSIGVGAVLLLIVIALGLGLRGAAIRPTSRLTAEVRQVAGGDFDHIVATSGPRELRELGDHVNAMRERILRELSSVRAAHAVLDARTQDLQRSNAELEQFAYVASHDLQEPLRKVASFCQLLQRRYGGRLDERADQYIGFAVDGAKRMQILINDLLAFSRVGRTAGDSSPVAVNTLVDQAKTNLADTIEWTKATIEVGDLPLVRAEVPLLTAVFQNLIGNALKFRGDSPPHISVSAKREGDFWL